MSTAQIQVSHFNTEPKPTIDHKPCEVCVRYIGKTYNYIAPIVKMVSATIEPTQGGLAKIRSVHISPIPTAIHGK
ncbi:MAG: hypothetical protein CFE24_03140 [Flavobacterium sp. BFFFF2]|nr:MAG: hypothetical protein CFE24_03140 [Flavobacterium sp. BFFFF2]